MSTVACLNCYTVFIINALYFLHISFCPTKIILQLEGGNRITVLQAYVRTLDNLNANLASKKIAA